MSDARQAEARWIIGAGGYSCDVTVLLTIVSYGQKLLLRHRDSGLELGMPVGMPQADGAALKRLSAMQARS